MIPRLAPSLKLKEAYPIYLKDLKNFGFSGEIKSDLATRLIWSTDNSVYQILPQAVIFPRTTEDVQIALKLLEIPRYRSITLSPRGGGTGTNGQSLSPGIIIDLSKHMNRILEIDKKKQWVRIQPGVVLDQLNEYLKPLDRFFAPTVSTSSRATLGGMINTDASGKGSLVFGKTSDHIVELEFVMVGGEKTKVVEIDTKDLKKKIEGETKIAGIFEKVDHSVTSKQKAIKTKLPKLKRFLSGYNLEKIYSEDRKSFNLNYLLAGSEGTLAIITEARLKLTKPQKYKKLLLVQYAAFDDALRSAELLSTAQPAAIETIDDTIVALAKEDPIYYEIKDMIKENPKAPTKAINLVEFTSNNKKELDERIAALRQQIQKQAGKKGKATGDYLAESPAEIQSLWELRKKGVGLLGNAKGNRKPIPFVEDTAVPPHLLADYILEFRQILDGHGLRYGMFGHIDVGCLHVRPALDMKLQEDEERFLDISEKVKNLVQKYGGVMWAEHGKGFRSQYTPDFFGPELYEELRRIKQAFDPNNQLNPGKIVTPLDSEDQVVKLRSSFRGDFDKQIHQELYRLFEPAINCNGNGACFHYSPDEVICPSMKLTRDRVHSPKGRAGLVREWVRLLTESQWPNQNSLSLKSWLDGDKRVFGFLVKLYHSLQKWSGEYDYSHEVYQAMSGCLACKACATQCPVKVEVPEFRSLFLKMYHHRYLRPIKDHLAANVENTAKIQASAPKFFNWLQSQKPTLTFLKNLGIVDPPKLSELSLDEGLKKRGLYPWKPRELRELDSNQIENSVILVQDAFTSFYEAPLVLAVYDFMRLLGLKVFVMPFFENGKALHIKGFLDEFKQQAAKNNEKLSRIQNLKIPMIGIDPAVTLSYRDEYKKTLGEDRTRFFVYLLQEWLEQNLSRLDASLNRVETIAYAKKKRFALLGHCTEKTLMAGSQDLWVKVFQRFGLELVKVASGCCGMGGIYGHETEHKEDSRKIYESSWQKKILAHTEQGDEILITGYSCRSQVKRLDGLELDHPIQALVKSLRSTV